jgi:hypothetical protein
VLERASVPHGGLSLEDQNRVDKRTEILLCSADPPKIENKICRDIVSHISLKRLPESEALTLVSRDRDMLKDACRDVTVGI